MNYEQLKTHTSTLVLCNLWEYQYICVCVREEIAMEKKNDIFEIIFVLTYESREFVIETNGKYIYMYVM